LAQHWPFERLVIIGTTHVDTSSIERVRRTISETGPSVVAVELDEERLWALRDPNRGRLGSPFDMGLLPWLLALLERSVGSLTQVFPGTEMLEAVEEAQKIGARVVMIDKPVTTILDDLGNMRFSEKVRIGIDSLVALLGVGARWRPTRPPSSDLEELMAEFDVKYPTLSRILVKERDEYMANKLREVVGSTAGRVVAVVGLGHVKGITEHLARQGQTQSWDPFQLRYEWSLGTS
jgi:pheromone shutdown protein TraB